jgi:molybdopterin-binding protein
MNKIYVQVEKIDSNKQLFLLTLSSKEHQFKMISLEINSQITQGSDLIISTKAVNIAIAKNYQGILSYDNQLNVTINSIEMGELLCSLTLKFEEMLLESIISAESAKEMQLNVGDRVIALIQATDLAIMDSLV